jgi:hypothetical protein
MDSLQAVVKYVRFERMGVERYGIWEDDRVKELYGSPLSGVRETGREFLRSEVRFLVPCLPSKVLAVGLRSRRGPTPGAWAPGCVRAASCRRRATRPRVGGALRIVMRTGTEAFEHLGRVHHRRAAGEIGLYLVRRRQPSSPGWSP